MHQQDFQDLNLFTVLEQGDRKIDTLKDQVIMMVGRTRSGKSCSYNWILNREMIGEGDQIEAFYIPLNKNDSGSAEVSNQFVSKTLIPNLADINSKLSLLDMAGYGDTRNYVGVMGVSYFLKSVFQKVKFVKFLIVFNEHEFFDTTGSAIISTFNGFLSMFKNDLLTVDIKKKLFNSISLLITRAKSPHLHSNYLERVVKQLKAPLFKCANKELMIEMIQKLLPMNRIGAFEMAIPNENSKPCKILQNFDLLKWEFMNVREVSSVFNIPFEADYKTLTAEDKNSFEEAINERIQIYSGFASIIQELMDSLKLNWSMVVDCPTQNIADNFIDSVLSFENVFASIQDFLDRGDKYHSQNLIKQNVKSEYPRLSLVEAIRKVLAIYEIASDISNESGDFVRMMGRYTEQFEQLVECILPFCKNAAEQKLILRLRFILARGFREFTKFYQIQPYLISRVGQYMKDNCSMKIHDKSSSSFIEHFIQNMSKQLLIRVFKNIPELEDYENLFNEYVEKYIFSLEPEKQNEERIQFNKSTIDIKFVKAGIYMSFGDRINAGKLFISTLSLLCTQGQLLQRITIGDVESLLNSLYMQKLQVVQKIVKILIELDARKYPNSKDLAISLCQYTNEIDYACEIYELILQSHSRDSEKRIPIYQNYADYCIKWGRYAQAKKLLQKKLRLQTSDFSQRTQTIESIYRLVQDYGRFVGQESKNILSIRRLEEGDYELANLLDKISQQIDQQINQSMS